MIEDAETKFFYDVTPERILESVEQLAYRCTGRFSALNSMENRVYEVEIDNPDPSPKSRSENFRIIKFYRPGRWSEQQIQEEHDFLHQLREDEIPVVAPEKFPDGSTLKKVDGIDIWFTVFPKVGGRNPEELTDEQVQQVGRLLARLHNVGSAKPAEHRIEISPQTYGRQNLAYLKESDIIPIEHRTRYVDLVEQICERSTPLFEGIKQHRLHGDCHLGNLLWGPEGPFWVDFDDMVRGPAVQDVWLVVPGRDDHALRQRQLLLDSYDMMRPFDRRELRLIEPLRALRFIHFTAWISKRWSDPAFPRSFPHYGTDRYWQEQMVDLQDQLRWIDTPQGYH